MPSPLKYVHIIIIIIIIIIVVVYIITQTVSGVQPASYRMGSEGAFLCSTAAATHVHLASRLKTDKSVNLYPIKRFHVVMIKHVDNLILHLQVVITTITILIMIQFNSIKFNSFILFIYFNSIPLFMIVITIIIIQFGKNLRDVEIYRLQY
jgi:hypothetical protein